MGLGGLTRDSIIGLNNLVANDQEDRPFCPVHNNYLVTNNGPNNDSDDFIFLDDDNPLTPTASQNSFETSLNDGLATTAAASAVMTLGSPSPPPTPYSNVSATNSRSLDSYRSNNPSESTSKKGAQAAHYQGFQYEGYTDYYSEGFASYDSMSFSNNNKGKEKKNIFCCLFAPWIQPASTDSEDQSAASSLEVEQNQTSHETAASSPPGEESGFESSASPPENIIASPVSPPTPSLDIDVPDAKSLNPDIVPTPSCLSEVVGSSEMTNLPTASENEPCVKFAAPDSEEKPSAPHLLSDGLSDSASVASTSPDFTCFTDEKKQEEGDPRITVISEASDEKEEDGPPRITSILKVSRCSMASTDSLSSRNNSKKPEKEAGLPTSPPIRHLFPVYEPKKTHLSKAEDKKINFNPMARVLTIPSRKDIAAYEKAQVWWQRCDYDEFKKTGRIISKAMECGGSEIWLASSNAWGNRAAQSRQVKMNKKNKSTESDEYNKALSKYINKEKQDGKNSNIDDDDFGEKWWCKFGHSRRGLEHIASPTEGKARQQSVLLAIRKVMEEQKRQRMGRMKDPNKLRNLAIAYTSWARELSLAAGSADAEAVASDFCPTASSRAQHFAKWFSDESNQDDTVGRGVAMAVTSQILDANTHAATPKGNKSTTNSLKNVNRNQNGSEELFSQRAKGHMPSGQGEMLNGIRKDRKSVV